MWRAGTGLGGSDRGRAREAVHARHLDVHQDRVELLRAEQPHRFLPVVRNHHGMTVALQHRERDLLVGHAVLDQQDALRRKGLRSGPGRGAAHRLNVAGERRARAVAQHTRDHVVQLVLLHGLHDPGGDAQLLALAQVRSHSRGGQQSRSRDRRANGRCGSSRRARSHP
jgi:hypothetical protein